VITPGTYNGSYGGATEVFQFETNGAFVQTLYLNGEAKYTNQGSWRFEKRPARFDPTSRIVLSSFVCAFDTRTAKLLLPPMNYGTYYADWDADKEQIEFDTETGYYLTKAKARD
jgi:hypothetical protein